MDDIPRSPGTYCLVYQLHELTSIQVGRLGRFEFQPGLYFYVGSAKGSGGLKARITRHLRQSHKKKFWHIDYFRDIAEPIAYFYSLQMNKECEWVQNLIKLGEIIIPVNNFGASDCRNHCGAHLLMTDKTKLAHIHEQLVTAKFDITEFVWIINNHLKVR